MAEQKSAVIRIATEAEFRAFSHEMTPGVVLFWADWCGPSRMQVPVFEKLAAAFGCKVRTATVDIGAAEALADQCEIATLPAFMVLCGDELLETMIGFQMEPYLEELFVYLRDETPQLVANVAAAAAARKTEPAGSPAPTAANAETAAGGGAAASAPKDAAADRKSH